MRDNENDRNQLRDRLEEIGLWHEVNRINNGCVNIGNLINALDQLNNKGEAPDYDLIANIIRDLFEIVRRYARAYPADLTDEDYDNDDIREYFHK